MGFWTNYQKFKKHLKTGGLVYAIWRGVKYFTFLIKRHRDRYKRIIVLLPKQESFLLEVSKKSDDILLIQCPPWDTMTPPLGVAYLSSYLRKQGYKTSVFDLNISLYNTVADELKFLWEQKSHDWWIKKDLFSKSWVQFEKDLVACLEDNLKNVDTQFIGLSVNSTGINFAVEFLKILNKEKKSEAKIILGGWGCITEEMRSHYPRELVDIFVVGEGEETLREIIEVSREKEDRNNIIGSIFIKDKRLIYKPRPPIKDLDNIPWPTFSEFDISQYRANTMLPLLTSRGCIGNCSFCNDCILSRPYRFRNVNNILEEIIYHIENNHTNHFALKDLLCNGNMHLLNSLSESIINSRIKISWDSQAIPRKEMTYEILCKLKRSGCKTLIYGVESFSNNVLKGMRKIFTKEIAERVLEDTYKAGIDIFINIIVGFPGETEGDFKQTLDGIKRNRRYISRLGTVSVCLVNNDSDLETKFQKYKLILSDDPKIRAKEWSTLDGRNNYQIRRKRANRIIALLNEFGLAYETTTI